MSLESLTDQPEHSPPQSSAGTEEIEEAAPQRKSDDAEIDRLEISGETTPANLAGDSASPIPVSPSSFGQSQSSSLTGLPTAPGSTSSTLISRSVSFQDLPASPSSLSERPLASRSDPNLESLTSTPILKLKRKTSKTKTKSVAFVDVTGSEVESVVAERTKQRSNRQLRAFTIFNIQDSVQLFFIEQGGAVHTQEDTTSLHLVRLIRKAGRSYDEDERESSAELTRAPAFLQVGDWLYPLFPGCSPALITAFGTYIFPDLRNNRQGSAVALVLPQYVSPDVRETFETLLEYYGSVEDTINRVESYTSFSDVLEDEDFRRSLIRKDVPSAIVSTIKLAAFIIVTAISILTQFGVWLIHALAGFVRSKWHRASFSREVNPHILQGVLYAKSATNKGVIVTNYVAEHLQEGALNLSRLLAPRPSVIPSVLKDSYLGSMVNFTATVSVTAYGGVSEVHRSLGDAASTLMDVFSEETVKTMEYRYGENYAFLTKEAFGAALNVRTAITQTHNIASLTFVPSTIGDQVKERFHKHSQTDITIDHTHSPGHSHHHDSTGKKALSHVHSHGHSSSHQEDEHVPESISSALSMPHKKTSWIWSSTSIAEQAKLQAKIADTDSESMTSGSTESHLEENVAERPAQQKVPFLPVLPEEVQKSETVDHFHPLRRSSSEEAIPTTNSRTALPVKKSSSFLSMRTESSMSQQQSSLSSYRRSSTASGPTRRQSVYLSYRRQSMHVNAAMAAAVERQYVTQGPTSVLAGCHTHGQRNGFKAAAICIARAKIRRRHREKSREKFLVVVQLSLSQLALRKDKHGQK